jgi:hypothetical protein
MPESGSEDYARGVAAGREHGRIDAELREVREHVKDINGSIERSIGAQRELADVVRALAEDARLREERVVAAAEALASETERRRRELADRTEAGDRGFSRRERILSAAVGLAGLAYIWRPF